MVNLEIFDVSANKLKELPTTIENMTSLKKLNARSKNVETLEFSNNYITTIQKKTTTPKNSFVRLIMHAVALST